MFIVSLPGSLVHVDTYAEALMVKANAWAEGYNPDEIIIDEMLSQDELRAMAREIARKAKR